VKWVALLAVLTLVLATGASASSGGTLTGDGVTLSLPAGWHGLVGPGGVQAADFPLPRRASSSANLVRVRRGHVHVIVVNYGPWVPYLLYRPARPPLALRKRDLTGAMEGFGTSDVYALRTARLGGDMIEVLADFGPKPLARSALRRANAVLATLRVLPPTVVRPRNGRLAADGVAVRLLPGWTGRIEIPAHRFGARLVLRAARGDVHVELVEGPEAPMGDHVELPIVLTSRNVFRPRDAQPLARRLFSNAGRNFDLTATARSPRDLREANRLLATLAVAPRPWTFRSCDLSLRLPGTWHVAIKPRGGCYPVLKLHGPGVLAVLSELRPGERAGGRILRRADRRFRVEVRPASARGPADAVVATLRAMPRCSVTGRCRTTRTS
jgi:hypothetical protein